MFVRCVRDPKDLALLGSRALRARNPKRVRKESDRVRPGVRKESEKSPKLRSWTLFGLQGALLGDSWAPRGLRAPGHPFELFLGSFGVPGPKGPGALCARPGGSQPKEHKHFRPGTWPAGSVTRVTEKLCMCLFWPPPPRCCGSVYAGRHGRVCSNQAADLASSSEDFLPEESNAYDRPDQLQRPRTPDLENSRKTAEKGAEWALV